MTVVGLVTEYNPFHNGHIYHIEQAKQLTGAATVVAVMSGNFVQRGMPAIFDKWTRARFALEHGIDVVYELPLAFAVQPGHIFARGAIQILVDAGVDAIVFGAEHVDWDFMALAKVAREKLTHAAAFKDYSQTYATAVNTVLQAELGVSLTDPNDILGLSYASALLDLGLADRVQLQPIQRVAARYHDVVATDEHIASATTIRALAAAEQFSELIKYVPTQVAAAFASPAVVQEWDEWLPLLRYRVQMSPVSALEKIYQLNDGLAFRLHTVMDRLPKNASMTELMARYKSKRYTQARLQRSLLYTLLNITDDEMQLAMQQPYLRVLGTTGRGRQFIKDHRQQVALPVVNRTDEQAIAGLQKLDYRAGRLYELMTNPSTNGMHQDTGRIPIILE